MHETIEEIKTAAADPQAFQAATYAWVIGLSAWGGIANFCRKMKEGHSRPFNIVEFIGEIVISGFVGVMTFYICQEAKMSGTMSAVFVGISGHMGSRAIFMIERWISRKIEPQ